MKFKSKVVALCAVYLFSLSAYASTWIDNNTYISDNTSGLDWLDLSFTTSRSYDSVYAELGIGGEFSGWRYATQNELTSLLTPFITNPTSLGFHLQEPLIDDLIQALGPTQSTINGEYEAHFVNGLLAEQQPQTDVYMVALIADEDFETPDTLQDEVSFNFGVAGFRTAANRGSFLVRETSTVPSPATAWLFFFGLIGLIGMRKKSLKVTTAPA